MKALINKVLRNSQRNQNRNLRTKARILHNNTIPQFLTLKDKNNNHIRAKLIDISNDGCRLMIPNMQVFEQSEFSIVFNRDSEIKPLTPQTFAKVVWSKMLHFDGARYCTTGIQFVTNSPQIAELNQGPPHF